MKAEVSKTSRLFYFALAAGFLVHLVLALSFPFAQDESFYITIPYRLLQGDSLIRHEWHLSQLSSVFLYVPVWLWVTIAGSADGVLLFLRCVYLCIYTAVAIITYRSLKAYGKWAIAGVLLFYTQTPYRILSLNYNSIFTLCILLIALCLLSIPERPLPRTAFAAGVCAGCCCVCNPVFAGVYGLYLLFAALRAAKRHYSEESPAKPWDCFFRKKLVLSSLAGLAISLGLTATYFFLTGGTIASVFSHLPLLLQSSEYGLGVSSLLKKIWDTYKAFSYISFHMPFFLPALYLSMLLDKKRFTFRRRCLYLFLALILGVMYIPGILRCVITNTNWTSSLFFSLPLLILTTTCYVLTEKKNKKLFFRMWLPCALTAFVQFIPSNTMLSALGFIFAVCNVAGVVFAGELYREMAKQSRRKLGRRLICAGLCLQMVFHLFVYATGQLPQKNGAFASRGPCAGMLLSQDQQEIYQNTLKDLDHIKAISEDNDPLLILSYSSWMYLYTQQPFSTYTTWFDNNLHPESLSAYYEKNPQKIPKYIYIDALINEHRQTNIALAAELFTFTTQELSQGTLLIITGCKAP